MCYVLLKKAIPKFGFFFLIVLELEKSNGAQNVRATTLCAKIILTILK